MELKQLEFFIAASECGSLSKAAEKLYTSQPNMSKVIRSLENELAGQLFERTSRGIKLTPYGKSIYEYASNIIKNTELIKATRQEERRNTFYLSTYQSNFIASLLVELYKNNSDINIRHRQGTVEEIVGQVEHGVSEMGILYVSQKRLKAFLNIIMPKKLNFVKLKKLKACIYVGENSPLYNRNSISFEELLNLRYVRGFDDFFSIENGLEHISLGVINSESLQQIIYTNSEHLSINFLLKTDLVDIGINLNYDSRKQYNIKSLPIEGEDTYFILGYIIEDEHILSKYAKELVEKILTAL